MGEVIWIGKIRLNTVVRLRQCYVAGDTDGLAAGHDISVLV